MAKKAVWGIDVGDYGLKAVKAVARDDRIQVLTFDRVDYGTSLSQAGERADQLVRDALTTFLRRSDVRNCQVSTSMPGHAALIRFIKLPPVERKKIPDIVRYEANQQIPFPLDEVVWDYQAIDRGYIPGEQVEVGIFAQRRELIHTFLSNIVFAGLKVDILQLAPVALYNFVSVDSPPTTGAKIVLDIGADNTSLIIASGDTIWTRNLPIAGNDLTHGVERAFNISFDKAEKLKISADKSKYSQKIYEAMRPGLRSLVDEIQRSIGFYKSVHPDVRFEEVFCFGSTFRLVGVERFFATSLNYKIERFREPRMVDVSSALNKDVFDQDPETFGVALGLVMQALARAPLQTNLLPPEIVRIRAVEKKRPYVAAALGVLALIVGLGYARAKSRYNTLQVSKPDEEVGQLLKDLENWENGIKQARADADKIEIDADKLLNVGKNRGAWLYTLLKLNSLVRQQGEGAITIKSIASSQSRIPEVPAPAGAPEKKKPSAMPGMGSPMGGQAPPMPSEKKKGKGDMAEMEMSMEGEEAPMPSMPTGRRTGGMPGMGTPMMAEGKGKPAIKVVVAGETKAKKDYKTGEEYNTFAEYLEKGFFDPLQEDKYFQRVGGIKTNRVFYYERDGRRVGAPSTATESRAGGAMPYGFTGAAPGMGVAPGVPAGAARREEEDLSKAERVEWCEFEIEFYIDPELPVPSLQQAYLGMAGPREGTAPEALPEASPETGTEDPASKAVEKAPSP